MCDPVTAGTALTIGAQVAKGYSAYQQGVYANDVAKYNARVVENKAEQVQEVATQETLDLYQQTQQLKSTQRAAAAAGGISLESQNIQQIQQDTDTLFQADARRIRRNTELERESLFRQADMIRAEGRAAEKAGEMGLGVSLLGAAGSGVAAGWFSPDSAAVTTMGGSSGSIQSNPFGSMQPSYMTSMP